MIKTVKKIFFIIIECIIIFSIAYLMCRIYNRYDTIKALHKDDVANYISYLKTPDIKEWIFTHFEGQKHYRPVFYVILHSIFRVITKNVEFIMIINTTINSIIALVVYFVARNLKINKVFAWFLTLLYICSPFSYYQMYQAIGCIEAVALLLSLIILFVSYKSVSIKKPIYCYILNAILYLLLVFNHERYFPIMVLMLLAIYLNKKPKIKIKIIVTIFYLLILSFFFVVRYHFLGIWVPRGTDCTMLLEYLDWNRAIKFIGMQYMYILGIFLGEEYLCGINFKNCLIEIQVLIVVQAIILISIIALYFVVKGRKKRRKKTDNFVFDIFVAVYIFFCILQSSLTIRLELRWVYASFTVFTIYIAYIATYLIASSTKNKLQPYFSGLFIAFVCLRLVLSFYVRQHYNKIHITNEQIITNNFAEITVYKYGIENIRNRNIYITSNYYDIFYDDEFTHFFDIFDGKLGKKQNIYIIDTDEKRLEALKDKNGLFINEDLNLKYEEIEVPR